MHLVNTGRHVLEVLAGTTVRRISRAADIVLVVTGVWPDTELAGEAGAEIAKPIGIAAGIAAFPA